MKSKCKDTHQVIIMEIVTTMENQAAKTSLVSTAHGIHKASLLPVLRRCSNVSPAAVGWEGHRKGGCWQGILL